MSGERLRVGRNVAKLATRLESCYARTLIPWAHMLMVSWYAMFKLGCSYFFSFCTTRGQISRWSYGATSSSFYFSFRLICSRVFFSFFYEYNPFGGIIKTQHSYTGCLTISTRKHKKLYIKEILIHISKSNIISFISYVVWQWIPIDDTFNKRWQEKRLVCYSWRLKTTSKCSSNSMYDA